MSPLRVVPTGCPPLGTPLTSKPPMGNAPGSDSPGLCVIHGIRLGGRHAGSISPNINSPDGGQCRRCCCSPPPDMPSCPASDLDSRPLGHSLPDGGDASGAPNSFEPLRGGPPGTAFQTGPLGFGGSGWNSEFLSSSKPPCWIISRRNCALSSSILRELSVRIDCLLEGR